MAKTDCEIAPSSELGEDKELAKRLYFQTIQTLKKVTQLEVAMKSLEDEAHTSDAQDDEVEALQNKVKLKNT